ncbi:MAG TPA: UDP-N-acetylmuramate dehydrogenase, partial [Myxococcaceae bacterium]|nr:UDP-N-acetylmuramate dehydrogenase [Myxococcaceae bacterium]
GLKGLTAGKAQVSAMHANWMVNLGGAAAADFDALIDEARRVVRERSGMVLHPEVKRAGVFL